jgi:WD40 repeat protein
MRSRSQAQLYAIMNPLIHADKMLVVLPATTDFFFIWDVASRSFEKISLGGHAQQQEMLVACWSSDSTKLVIGASKGALLVFDTTMKKVLHNVQGVHERVRA